MSSRDRVARLALGTLALFLLGSGEAWAQRQVRPFEQKLNENLVLTKGRFKDAYYSRFEAPYINYGWIDYEQYRENIPIFKRYDSLGNYLTEGFEVFRMEEFRGLGTAQEGSTLFKGEFYQDWLRHLVIVDDSYGGWNTRVSVGDAIRTTFTPLTLDMARFNGVRWDQASPNNRFTIILSRLSDPLKIDIKNQFGPAGKRLQIFDGMFLLGGHWESHVGDFLVLGATYVNLHRFDSTRGFSTNTRRGLAPPFTTTEQVIVRFQDDSPDDHFGGAVIFDVHAVARIREGGEDRFEELSPSATTPSSGVVERGPGVLEASGRFVDRDGLRLPNFVDYSFEVPDSTIGVEVSAVVANDYRILMKQRHRFDPPDGRGGERETGFIIIRRAEGNITDLSNKRRVQFEEGLQTGQEVVGLNGEMKLRGFEIKGEIARSTTFFQFTHKKGRREDFDGFGGYLTVKKKIRGVHIGVEGFHISPKYNSYAFKNEARERAEARPDLSDKGVDMDFFDKRTVGTPYFFNDVRQDPISTDQTEGGNKLNDPIFALVDDNDDQDQWPDDWVQDWDVEGRDTKYLESDAGIYPFFDFDADGFADNNRNRNEFKDSEEPFLMYFTDPREFYFGDDFNNNFLLDIWEDDDQPNYPYFKDEEGFHLTATFQPLAGLTARVGRYDINQIAGGGRNEASYGRIRYERQLNSQWWVRLDHESKDVQDDIANPHFDFQVRRLSDGRLIPEQLFFPDFLDARDSFINRGLLHVKYHPLEMLHFNFKFRYELNDQRKIVFDSGEVQSSDELHFFGLLAKTDYTYFLGRWAIMPRLKIQYILRERDSAPLPFEKNFMFVPILRFDYRLSSRSQIRLGAQGVPVLYDRRVDFRDRDEDANKQSYILMWFNQTDYNGYKLGTELGMEYQSTDFDVRGRPSESFVRYFLRVIAGVGTVR